MTYHTHLYDEVWLDTPRYTWFGQTLYDCSAIRLSITLFITTPIAKHEVSTRSYFIYFTEEELALWKLNAYPINDTEFLQDTILKGIVYNNG